MIIGVSDDHEVHLEQNQKRFWRVDIKMRCSGVRPTMNVDLVEKNMYLARVHWNEKISTVHRIVFGLRTRGVMGKTNKDKKKHLISFNLTKS
jgi:hypothetical protein